MDTSPVASILSSETETLTKLGAHLRDPASHLGSGENQLKSSSLQGEHFTQGATFPAPGVKPHEKVVWTVGWTGKSFLKKTSQAGLRVETKKTAKKWDLEACNCQYLCNSFTGNSVHRILLHLAFFFYKYFCPCYILHWLLSYSTLLVPQTWCILGTLYTALLHLTSIHICLCHTYPLVTAQMWMPERHDTQDKLRAIRTLVTVTFHFSSWFALSQYN